jgi:hypothetical protein
MKYLVAVCWIVTIPIAIVVLSYKSAYYHVEHMVGEELQ